MMNWFDLDLRSLFRDFVLPRDRGEEAEGAFVGHLRRMESRVIFLLMSVAGLAIFLIWPTDWLMFEDRALSAFFRWRLSVLLIIAGSLLAMMVSDFIRYYAAHVLVTAMGLSAFVVCYIFGQTFSDGFGTPFFYWTYVLPFVSCFILSLRFIPRVLANLGMVVPSFVGFLLADPTHLQYRYAASPFLVQLGFIPVAVIAGHLVHNLYRRYFFLNRQLESSVEEKDFLFQELNHRVKNNMQVIMSLLKLRSNEIDDPSTREKFLSLRRRIRAMALVHEKLYQTEEYSKLDLEEYLDDLLEGLMISQGDRAEGVDIELNVKEGLEISLRRAVPLGLIVNELVSNALEHAFDGHTNPVISVGFTTNQNENVLKISDNGRGFPVDEPDFEETFGLNIVRTLLHQQLEGSMDLEQNDWTVFRIAYTPEEPDPETENLSMEP
jgi:two-component sensor histidine kinase